MIRRTQPGLLPCLLLALLPGTASAQDSRPGSPEPEKDPPKKEESAVADGKWKVGELVPDVTMRGSDGEDHRLRDLVGKKPFVIAWYPKSFTGG